MRTRGENPSLNGLISEIVSFGRPADVNPDLREVVEYFRGLSGFDYAAAMRTNLDHKQLREVYANFASALPGLNQQVFAIKDLRRLGQIAWELGVAMQAQTFEGARGRALRGFYVNDTAVTPKPLIVVNTANHPVAVACSFWHEVGHHLTHRLFDSGSQVNLAFNTNYAEHLKDPKELAADILIVMAGYPASVARNLFSSERNDRVTSAENVIAKVQQHLKETTGFDFNESIAVSENLYYLAGMIHFAKLRAALLTQYRV